MTESTTTPFSSQAEILADLWLNYKQDTDFIDFIEYNDIGLPLAYCVSNDIVKSTDLAEKFITETFSLLVSSLGLDDTGFDNLDELLSEALPEE
jgi:hypothetical protein